MLAIIEWNEKKYEVDLSSPVDISLPLRSGDDNPNAFGIQPPLFEPFRAGNFVGSVKLGGSANCENLLINAHGNGTHTECVGHISDERITINECLTQFFSIAQVVSMPAEPPVITRNAIEQVLNTAVESLIIRTLPNGNEKLVKKYSGNDPAYLEAELCAWLCEKDIRHLLIDLPSVDAEEDGGDLAAHHAFWNYPAAPRRNATISEMIFVKNEVEDGIYLLNLQIASLETDASPSKPVLYRMKSQ